MADTIKIPGIGPLNKKYAYVGAAGIAGFVGYAYWRSRQSSNDTAGDGTDNTDLQDANAAASDANAGDAGDSGYAYGGGSYYPSPPWWSQPGSGNDTITSDPEWYQKAVEWLENTGVDAQIAGQALSLYMADLCLSNTQGDYVRQAKSALGGPPQSQHRIQICPTGGGSGSSGSAPGNFRVIGTDKSSVTLGWSAVSGASSYLLHVDGNGQNHSITVKSTTGRVSGLKSKQTYHFNVRGVVSGKNTSASKTISVKTK
jgi:hypothetical protein